MKEYKILISDSLDTFVNQVVAESIHTDVNDYIRFLIEKEQGKAQSKTLSQDITYIDKIRLFNEKATRLENYKLWQFLEKNSPSFSISSDGLKFNDYPEQELVDAPILTLRLFFQDNDYISIRNIANAYTKLDIPTDLLNQFNTTRQKFTKFIESDSLFSYEDKTFSNKEILDAVIYGELSHLTKQNLYRKLFGDPVLDGLNKMQFYTILKMIKYYIIEIRNINQQTLNYLTIE